MNRYQKFDFWIIAIFAFVAGVQILAIIGGWK